MKRYYLKLFTVLLLILVLSGTMVAFAAPEEAPETASTVQSASPAPITSAPETGEQLPAASSGETPEAYPSPEASGAEESAVPTPEESFLPENTIPETKGIIIASVAELQRIGQDEGYPLTGSYVLANDVDGGGAAFAPIGSAEAPFAGTLDGNGHTIANLQITGCGLFANLTGRVGNLALRDIAVNAAGTAGVLAGTVSGGAEITDVFLTGTVTIPPEQAESAAIGGLAGRVEGAVKIGNVQAYVKIQGTDEKSKLVGALAGENSAPPEVYAGCLWSGAYGAAAAFGVDSAVNEAPGAATLKTEPAYLALMTGERGTAAANTGAAAYGLAFSGFENTDETIMAVERDGTAAVVTAADAIGAADVVSVYTHVFSDGGTAEIRFLTPVIVSQNIGGEQPLEPVDPIFPTQIEEVKDLEPVDGIFPTQIERIQMLTNDGVIEIRSWEQFKNIGNTEYDPAFTLDADYVLAGDIIADAEPFTPIGTEEAPFTGTFDGAGYTIDVNANGTIDQSADYYGLFGVVRRAAQEISDETEQ